MFWWRDSFLAAIKIVHHQWSGHKNGCYQFDCFYQMWRCSWVDGFGNKAKKGGISFSGRKRWTQEGKRKESEKYRMTVVVMFVFGKWQSFSIAQTYRNKNPLHLAGEYGENPTVLYEDDLSDAMNRYYVVYIFLCKLIYILVYVNTS